MSILDNITRIEQAKKAIKDAIITKGVSVSDNDKLDSYADKIIRIKGSSGDSSALTIRTGICNFTTFTSIPLNEIRQGEFLEDG